ncbi:glucuronate isomerase [Cysteiniphilum halobium]|uniref:glucuronate isomerase n=1 Tax=Cysteiniphilum halobium TaxID=2219059 RepID=UPI000E647A59|nr:glucuronate isomerase [Cysteiniphilum halobium]
MFTDMTLFPSQQRLREIALGIYHDIKGLPIVSPHGHTDPKWFAENKPFSNPVELLIKPDHYIYRMFYSQGLKLEDFGIQPKDNSNCETDPHVIWESVAKHWYLFAGTQVGLWFDAQLKTIFGIDETLTPNNATSIYQHIYQSLQKDEFLPQGICKRYNIEVIATTDNIDDTLYDHQLIRNNPFSCKIIPTFRPDTVTNPELHPVHQNIHKLGESLDFEITDFKAFLDILRQRRLYFKENGATATDHGVSIPQSFDLSEQQAESLFQRIIHNTADWNDKRTFSGQMLTEMAKMAADDGLVMQIHAGCMRNHNRYIQTKFGHDKGCDIPQKCDYVNGLYPLLNKVGNDKNFRLILFTMDESVYSRELAPLAGHYPSVFLGPPWWFNDSPEGMMRFREATTEIAGFYNTTGFIDDTRALLSIPVRHDIARRVDSHYLAKQVVNERISFNDAQRIATDITYHQSKRLFKL